MNATGDGTVTNTGNVTTGTTLSSGAGVAQYYTKHFYGAGAAVLRARVMFSMLDANSERYAGFASTDLTQCVAVHLNGASTQEFLVKSTDAATSVPITVTLTSWHIIEIVWTPTECDLYFDDAVTPYATITTNIPTTSLPVMFSGAKIP